MKPICVAFSLALALYGSETLARSRPARVEADAPNCALEAQKLVAQRHRLPAGDSSALSMRIYASPELAVEADNLFDACVRKHSGVR
jgi:hypothetical protein